MRSNNNFFCKKVYLLLAGLVHIAQAALIYFGKHYYSAIGSEAVYTGFPNMLTIDRVLAGVLSFAAILQVCCVFGEYNKGRRVVLRLAYLVLIISQIGYSAARYHITGLTLFTYSQTLQTVAYVLILTIHLFEHGNRESGREYEERNIVYSSTVLQGAGSAPGDGEGSENKDVGTDPEGKDS